MLLKKYLNPGINKVKYFECTVLQVCDESAHNILKIVLSIGC